MGDAKIADDPKANEGYNDPGMHGPPPIDEVDPAELKRVRGEEQGATSVVGGANTEPNPGPQDQDGPNDDNKDEYDEMNKEALEAAAQERNLTVEGTGSGGNVKVEDLRKALREDDAAKSGA